ncbi:MULTISPECIES: ubiquinone-dependent pyruvate dehydrogenase [Brevibacterium]|uniref:Pyruvate dehydrogenase [ubiquinone] n=2 Tax=Brevibacterium casei TaxID=33889 RepID=K9AHF6_9MICO|nr:ubiquinone-dependent pyruvate dehydrogenase [Brevibacterium casei]NJE67903.1 ubiquinone-dependent pyruvate dehydrogenase [Brevibacterium sp. LS14]EKU46748.1 pyruvate dehydrogenase (cytochrome) [Brevibacterium casei S18]KZE21703.1 pyruvate dehydrogenase [Brevibacterium casei]MCT1551602.1 ubiquinone-dependent pyruvate dehydrogenase [Brevibacterium casei]MCT1561528.1 ubiquinone-dependent pyruvate dehydrogenase [Brevibacterium casei]
MPTVARNIVDTLVASGVKRVYGIPGDSLNGFTDALRVNPELEWVHVRHEEGAAFAASGEAALTGELAVCAGSCGPGNLHLINGLYDAQRSRVPVLAIAAHIPSEEIGSNYFQETHPTEIFRECSVYAEHVAHPSQMPRLLRIAMREAIEKRGVAVLVIPGDVGLADIDAEAEEISFYPSRVIPAETLIEDAAAALNGSRKVTILAGAGTEGAHPELIAIAHALQAPIVHSMRGKEFVEYDNPFDVGMTGLLGFSSGYHALKSCDTLLMLGTDLPYQQFYPDEATVIQVDVRGSQIGKRTKVDIALTGTVADTVNALLPLIRTGRSSSFLKTATKHYAKTRKELDELATPSKRTIHPQYLTKLIDEAATDDAVFIPDVGSPVVWAARYLTMSGRRRLIGSFSHGSMANALSQSVGAQAAYPGRQVIALAGDGGLAMLLGELITLTQNDLPVKVVVYNNSSLNFVELEMKAAGFVTFGTDLENPNFATIAEAVGIKGYRVEKSKDLPAVVTEFLNHDGPAVLDVTTERQELSMPPSITVEQAKGFALYAIRTVLSGKGDELIDLARTNVRQLF